MRRPARTGGQTGSPLQTQDKGQANEISRVACTSSCKAARTWGQQRKHSPGKYRCIDIDKTLCQLVF